MKPAPTPKLIALHRHWIIADSVKVAIKRGITPEEDTNTVAKFGMEYAMLSTQASMFFRIQVWYALLYVVIEGYEELQLSFEPLDKVLLQRDYVTLLRRFRNATFHYQADPLNDKLIEFLDKADSEHWISELNKQMNAFFLSVLPIEESIKKISEFGMPQIPAGSKVETLFFGPKR